MGFTDRRRPGGRGRLPQLRSAQHAGRASRARHAGHAVPRVADPPADRRRPTTAATLLRTHTSAMQIRYMEAHQPPVRIIAPGRVYRRDNLDLTHTPMFRRSKGCVVGEGITLARPEGHAARVRARAVRADDRGCGSARASSRTPSRAPRWTSAAWRCGGAGCAMCKQHRLARDRSAAAWCIRRCSKRSATTPSATPASRSASASSASRCCKYGVDDIRLFYENDLRFLEQFPL